MARSGRFGRLPRRAPDLSGAIVALMSEYWNTTESLMVNAWREGGEVEGKVVDDDRMLQFWLDRRNSMQRDDPLWDYYNNQYQQYDFAIRESEVGLKYAQKKMSAREVARWYRGEAQKYVRDSEIYRTIAGQAARFLEAARNQAKADATERRGKAYVKTWEATYKENLLSSVYVTTGLTDMFRRLGLGAIGSQNLTQTDEGEAPALGEGSELTDLSYQTGSQQSWETVLGIINDPDGPYHDYFQKTWIDPAMRDGLALDLPLNQQDLEALMARSMNGYDQLIAVNKKFDDVAPKTGAASTDNLRKDQLGTLDTFQFLFVLDEVGIYSQRRRAFEAVINDPASTVFEQATALANYYKGLGALGVQVADQNPVMATALDVERRYLMGDSVGANPTVGEDALLTPFGNSPAFNQTPDSIRWSDLSRNLSETIEALTKGDAVAVMTNSDGSFTALTPGQLQAEFGHNYVIVPRLGNAPSWRTSTDTTQRILGEGAQVTTAGQITYGEVYETHPITVRSTLNPNGDPATGNYIGEELPAVGDVNIGMVAYLPDGNGQRTIPVYGISSESGTRVRWTTDNPFIAGSVLPGGIQSDPSNGSLTVWLDPSSSTIGIPAGVDGKPAFNPQGAIDGTLFNPNSASSFVDPGIAALAATPTGRHQIAQMDPEQLMTTLQSSPWMDWNDPADVTELWNDVAAVKASDAGGGIAGYAAQYQFYGELKKTRSPGGDIWDTMLSPTQLAINVSEDAIKMAKLAVRGVLLQRAGGMTFTAMPEGYQPGQGMYAPPETPKFNMPPGTRYGGGGLFGIPSSQSGPSVGSYYKPPTQPQINLNGQISVPNLPGATPTPLPGLGATPTPTPTPRPTPTPTMPTPPRPRPAYIPNVPERGSTEYVPGSHPGGGGR